MSDGTNWKAQKDPILFSLTRQAEKLLFDIRWEIDHTERRRNADKLRFIADEIALKLAPSTDPDSRETP